MGTSHFRSDIKEKDSGQTLSYSIGSFNDHVKAPDCRTTKYYRIGTNCYIIHPTTDTGGFTAASIGAVASEQAGIAIGDMGAGTLVIIGSPAAPASNLWMKVSASWLNIVGGNLV